MQYSQFLQQIIEDFKLADSPTLFQPVAGSLIEKFNDKEQLKESVMLFSHSQNRFRECEIAILFNSLQVNQDYIELSRTYYELKFTKSKHQEGQHIILIQNNSGKELIIALGQTQSMRIQIFLKKYCMNKNFLSKYQLTETGNCLPLAQTHKNQESYCVIIHDKRSFATDRDFEIFHNSITIQHALGSHPNLLKVYEDNSRFYLVCQHMRLQSLESLLLSGYELKEVPLVSVIFMVLQTLQKYNQKGIYHGNLHLGSIYFNIQSPILQIALLHPHYCHSKIGGKDDLSAVALLLYQITYFVPKEKIPTEVDKDMIMISRNILQEQGSRNSQSRYRFLYRVSQLDLLLQLVDSSTTFEKAMRHQWFVTIKQNLKLEQRSSTHKASLQTIIEQNESSMSLSQFQEMKIKMRQQRGSTTEQDEIEDENPQRETLQISNPFSMVPSKAKHDQLIKKLFQQSKTYTEVVIKRPSILDSLQLNRLQTLQ